MENATKALMIAAAVLVVMLIIGLGIGVFNMASEQVDNAGDLSEYQVQQINNKFTKYVGNVSGADVNALVTAVFTHNNAQETNATCVKITYPDATGTSVTIDAVNNLTSVPAKAATGERHNVIMSTNANTGIVSEITVSK